MTQTRLGGLNALCLRGIQNLLQGRLKFFNNDGRRHRRLCLRLDFGFRFFRGQIQNPIMPNTTTIIIGKIGPIEPPPVAALWFARADEAEKVTLAMTVATNSEIFSILETAPKTAQNDKPLIDKQTQRQRQKSNW